MVKASINGLIARFGRQSARAVEWIRRRRRRVHEAHGLVLMYHRIAAVQVDPWNLAVSPAHFDDQLRTLRRHVDIVPLANLFGCLRVGRHARPVVALTFDDGYVDNLEAAKPLLEHYAAPATVFVASGYTGRSEGFWWDRLAAAILVPAVLPAKLSLGHGETRFFWDDPRLVRADEGGRRARKRLHDALWNWLIDHIERERSWEIAKIEDWAGASRKDDHSSWPMNAQQIHDLVSGGLVDIGAHGVSHRRLTRLSRADKQEEIVRSRRDCEQISGAAPACFAFPNGDYDVECLEFVRQEGFLVGCTSRAGLAWASSDPLQVPRVSVRDVDGASLWREVRRKWLT